MEPAKVRVIAFTDRVGNSAYNLVLSKERALSIAAMLERVGFPRGMVEVVGKGEEDNIPEPTPDGVAEPLNRCCQDLRGRGQLIRVEAGLAAPARLSRPGLAFAPFAFRPPIRAGHRPHRAAARSPRRRARPDRSRGRRGRGGGERRATGRERCTERGRGRGDGTGDAAKRRAGHRVTMAIQEHAAEDDRLLRLLDAGSAPSRAPRPCRPAERRTSAASARPAPPRPTAPRPEGMPAGKAQVCAIANSVLSQLLAA